MNLPLACASATIDGEYVLPDEVRVPCLKCRIWTGGLLGKDGCVYCHGLGWTASTDGWVWWRALRDDGWSNALSLGSGVFEAVTVKPESPIYDDDSYLNAHNEDPEAAFFTALHAALQAMGSTMEVEDASHHS